MNGKLLFFYYDFFVDFFDITQKNEAEINKTTIMTNTVNFLSNYRFLYTKNVWSMFWINKSSEHGVKVSKIMCLFNFYRPLTTVNNASYAFSTDLTEEFYSFVLRSTVYRTDLG